MEHILQGSKTGMLTSPAIAVQDHCIKIISLGSRATAQCEASTTCRIIVVGGKPGPVL
jgi:hypothetical protein